VVVADGARFKAILADPDAAVLDICCGTGDMTMALLKRRPSGARGPFWRRTLRAGC
jgi:ubiquinone/menaquinone biosynthesis C-methylase UbiE